MSTRRAKIYQLTRNSHFLLKAAGIILSVAVLLSLVIQLFREGRDLRPAQSRLDVDTMQLRESYKRLSREGSPNPEALGDWLRKAAVLAIDGAYQASVFSREPLSVADCPVEPLIKQHTHSAEQAALFNDYAVCRLLTPSPEAGAARQRLSQATEVAQPPRYAGELLGDIYLWDSKHLDALKKYLLDVQHVESVRSREAALSLALYLKDSAALETLMESALVRKEAAPENLREAAMLLDNRRLLIDSQWKGFLKQWTSPVPVSMALIAASIWTVVIIVSAGQGKRAIFPVLAALACGVLSVELVSWWQDTLKYSFDERNLAGAGQKIVHWIIYVGIPEEAAKLIFCVPVIPWLLKHAGGAGAALLGGAVGLGFALAENIGYFLHYGEFVAMGRLLTANFLHASLTGILGWQLYDLVRSKFHRAGEFLAVFLIICVVHGLYDYFAGDEATEWGLNILAIILLALCARKFLHVLAIETGGRGPTVSRTAVFVIGATFLAGLVMVVLTWQNHHFDSRVVTAVIRGILALIPVGAMYIHEFREVSH